MHEVSYRQSADYHVAIGIKAKVENRGQYDQYLEELKPLREELGVSLKEDLYPEEAK
jgi:cytochrome c oxidase subunit 5a